MILKFKSKQQDSWTYRDNVKQVRTFECRFLPVGKVHYEGRCAVQVGDAENGARVVPVCVFTRLAAEDNVAHEEIGSVVEWTELVDPARLGSARPPEHKVLTVDYRDEAGWPTNQQILIFDRRTRIFLLNDQGDTVETL